MPYFYDVEVATVLARLGACCIVVDKQQRQLHAVDTLAHRGQPISSAYLDGFEGLAIPDEHGAIPIIHPHSGRLDPVQLGPVRTAGWGAASEGRKPPLLHAKLLVLGVTTYWENDEDFTGDVLTFHPQRVWMGSANWTQSARLHGEFGVWSKNPALVHSTCAYLLDLIRFSEPRESLTIGPTPQMAAAEWDDDAFHEYVAEYDAPAEDEGDETD